MNALATTTIDVFRDVDAAATPDPLDSDVDPFGDEVETPRADTADDADLDPDPHLRKLPASIIEQTRRPFDPTAGDLRTVKFVVGRVTSGTDIRRGDIVVDRKDGGRYRVNDAVQPQNMAMRLDLRLDLVRVN